MPARRRRRASAASETRMGPASASGARTGRGNAARTGSETGSTEGFSLVGDLSTMAAAMGVGDGLVEFGDRGTAVASLQGALGMAPEQRDGIFGRQTKAALVAFQRSSGLSADGIVGPNTMAALEARSAPAPQPPAPAPQPAHGPEPTPTPQGEERDAGLASAARLRDATADGGLLRAGASGAAVIEVQTMLGMEGAARTGTLDAATVDAVKRLQRDSGLSVDGVVGPSTMSALLRAGASKDIEGGVIFELGDVGPGVLALQKALGMGPEGQTGDFGPTTLQKLLEFQEKNGIQQTGKVGPTTWKKLKGEAFEGAPGGGSTEGYDAAIGEALVRASLRINGGSRRSTSRCYEYVADAVDISIGRFLSGRHAYMAASQLASKKDLFTEVSASNLAGLPAGAIVVWGKGNTESGHISIALGDGQESSDFVGPQMMSHYGGAGARVFLPKGRM